MTISLHVRLFLSKKIVRMSTNCRLFYLYIVIRVDIHRAVVIIYIFLLYEHTMYNVNNG